MKIGLSVHELVYVMKKGSIKDIKGVINET